MTRSADEKSRPAVRERLESLPFQHRRIVLLLFAIATIVMAWLATHTRIDAGFTKLVPLQHEYMETFLEHRDEFGGADRVAIALVAREGDMFTPEFFEVLRKATDAMFFLPGIDRTQVFSVVTPNVRYIEVVEDGISAGNVVPADFEPDEAGLARVRNNIIKAGIVGRLVANDFSGAIVSGKLQEFNPNTGERLDYIEVARELEQIRTTTAAHPEIDVHIIGFAKLVGDIADGTARVVAFFGITLVITFLFVFAYTRSLRLTLLPLVCSLTAVVWQLGGVSALGYGVDPMSILVPFLVFAIGVSHGVQMISAFRSEMLKGLGSLDAAQAGFKRLLLPGAVALASDTVGFITISFIEVQVIREIATTASLGVAAIILTNLVLLPVLLSYSNLDETARNSANARDRLLRPFWVWLAGAARPRPAAAIIVVAVALFAVGASIAPEVRVGDEHQGVPELRESSRYNRDTAVITEKFSIGVDVLTVIAESFSESCIDHEVMSILDEFEWRMRNVSGVQSVLGLAGVAQNINASWNEGNLKWRTLPRNTYSLVQAISPVQTSSGLLNPDCSIMPVHIYTVDHKAETIERIVDEVKSFSAENAASADRIRFQLAAGNVGVMAATNEEVEASQFPILAYVFIAVILLCLVSFRSITATLCIILPLGVVSLLAYALMAVLEIGLKISTLPVVALGIGIGVDYGIYIYGRLRGFLEEGVEFAQAYEETLASTGAGVMLTGLTLAAGVATWIVAPLKFQADMGIVLTFMFLVNMVGAVILLPALGAWFDRIGRLRLRGRST